MRKRFSAILLALTLAVSGIAAAPAVANSGGSLGDIPNVTEKQAKSKKLKLTKPRVTGTKRVGKTVRAKFSVASGATVKYKWYRNSTRIKNAYGKTYKLRSADKGKRISVRVTATKPGFSKRSLKSNKTSKIKGKKQSGSNSGGGSNGGSNVYYENCAAAGKVLYRGDPGYGSHLDRDGDGIACESYA